MDANVDKPTEMTALTVRCETVECVNAGVDIEVTAVVGGSVICGPCSVYLVDVVVPSGQV